MNKRIIQKVPLFKNTNEDFIREVALELKPVVFTPGDYIIRKGEIGGRMYFISRGIVDILSNDNKQVIEQLHEGDFFGKMAIILSMPRVVKIRSNGYCDLYISNKESFERVIRHHPEFKTQLNEIAKKRLDEIKKNQKKFGKVEIRKNEPKV